MSGFAQQTAANHSDKQQTEKQRESKRDHLFGLSSGLASLCSGWCYLGWDRQSLTGTIGVSTTDGYFVGGTPSPVVIPVVTFLTSLALYSSNLKDRQAMLSQFVFVLKMRTKQAFLILVHVRFLFLLSSPEDTCVII